jgi:serine/threonine protein kinase
MMLELQDEFCPSEEALLRLLDSQAPPDEREPLLRHLDGCSGCRLAVAETTRLNTRFQRSALCVFGPGEVLAERYRVERFIARGGMGEVYEATDLASGGRVAVKTLAAALLDDPGAAVRFAGEVRLAGRVSHPNLSRLLDFGVHHQLGPAGEAQPVSFLVMELLEGVSVTQRLLLRGPLTGEEVTALMRQVLAAVAAIHRAGIIHRDLKGDNVLLVPGPEGERAVVMDLGLARALDGSVLTTLPHLMAVVGTADCMAPEQIEGQPVGRAADVYALGLLLFEMLTARRPFPRLSPALRIARPAPLPSSLVPALSPEWDRVVVRCLARRPQDRFASVEELWAALARVPLGGDR